MAGRRSTRKFEKADISRDELAALLTVGHVPYCADWIVSPLNRGGIDYFAQADVFVAVNSVSGLEPGIYSYCGSGAGLAPLRLGDVRERVVEACLNQSLAGNASALIFVAPRLREYLFRFGNRGYRYAVMHAGVLGQRVYLAATALGLGVTGVAGIDEGIVNSLCNLDGYERTAVYALAVGHPAA
jgi:SagB-type dehydrogenase family enzyme